MWWGFAGRLCVSNTRVRVWLTLRSQCLPALVSPAVALTWRHRRRPSSFIMKGCNIIRDRQPQTLLWKSAKMYRGANGNTQVIWSTMTSLPLHELWRFHSSFCMSFLAPCYQLCDTRPATMVLLQPGREGAESPQRLLFVSLKLIHCHSTPTHLNPSPPPPTPLQLEKKHTKKTTLSFGAGQGLG